MKAERRLKEQPRPTVFVLDENVHVSSHIVAILELLDCEAIPISSTQEYIDTLDGFQKNSKKFDAVILGGAEAIRNGGFLVSQTKKVDKNIKILAIVRDKGDRHMLLAAGADAIATKPVSGPTLAFKILKLIPSVDLDRNG